MGRRSLLLWALCKVWTTGIYFFLHNDVNATRCDWSLPMIYQSTDTWMTSRKTCFLCFVQHGARFWMCLWHYFGLKQVKSLKMFNRSYLKERKTEKRETKRVLDYFRMPKTIRNLHNSCHRVSSLWETRRFCKMFSPLFCLEQGKTLKNVSKKLYTINIKKKKKERIRDEK